MKIDRLLAITIYLLNHQKTSASTLAEKFEVSIRTIQRDMESICLAGIPVVSTFGADGGYEIIDTFKMNTQPALGNDYVQIITALQGYASAFDDKKINDTLEKIQSISTNQNSNVMLDFSVAKEQHTVCEFLSIAKTAIEEKKKISFKYTNADNIIKYHQVEPIYVIYKWYAWYIIAYVEDKDTYAMYKLVRMEDLENTHKPFSKVHNTQEVFNYMEQRADDRKYMKIRFICSEVMKTKCIEYLKAKPVEQTEDGSIIMETYVFENEHFWYGTLLSLEDDIRILEPQKLIDRLCKSSENILKLYE